MIYWCFLTLNRKSQSPSAHLRDIFMSLDLNLELKIYISNTLFIFLRFVYINKKYYKYKKLKLFWSSVCHFSSKNAKYRLPKSNDLPPVFVIYSMRGKLQTVGRTNKLFKEDTLTSEVCFHSYFTLEVTQSLTKSWLYLIL